MLIVGVPVKNDKKSFKAMMESLHYSTKAYDKIIIIQQSEIDSIDQDGGITCGRLL